MKLNLVSPDLPSFNVTKTTPFAPLDPYIATEEASFNTEIDSILLLSISANKLGSVPKATPSTTINGEDDPVIEPGPRSVILGSPPASDVEVLILKPATLPLMASSALATALFSITFPETFETALVMFFSTWVP